MQEAQTAPYPSSMRTRHSVHIRTDRPQRWRSSRRPRSERATSPPRPHWRGYCPGCRTCYSLHTNRQGDGQQGNCGGRAAGRVPQLVPQIACDNRGHARQARDVRGGRGVNIRSASHTELPHGVPAPAAHSARRHNGAGEDGATSHLRCCGRGQEACRKEERHKTCTKRW